MQFALFKEMELERFSDGLDLLEPRRRHVLALAPRLAWRRARVSDVA